MKNANTRGFDKDRESSKTCKNTFERLDPQKKQLNQFKQYVKQLVCGNLTYAIKRN